MSRGEFWGFMRRQWGALSSHGKTGTVRRDPRSKLVVAAQAELTSGQQGEGSAAPLLLLKSVLSARGGGARWSLISPSSWEGHPSTHLTAAPRAQETLRQRTGSIWSSVKLSSPAILRLWPRWQGHYRPGGHTGGPGTLRPVSQTGKGPAPAQPGSGSHGIPDPPLATQGLTLTCRTRVLLVTRSMGL